MKMSLLRFSFLAFALTILALLAGCGGNSTYSPEGVGGGQPPVVSISVSANPTTITTGGSSQCTATVTGTSNTAVTWSVIGGTFNSSGMRRQAQSTNGQFGTITSGGLYTAPNAAGTFTIQAVSQADPSKSATVSITVNIPGAFTVTVTAKNNPILTGATDQCTATVSTTGYSAIQWSVPDGEGSISSSGLYTAPSIPGTYTITATTSTGEGAITESGTVNITVQQSPFTVGVTAQTNPILTGATDTCTATVSVTGYSAIQWSVPDGDGSISSTGVYTAPSSPGTYTITATTTVGGLTESGTVNITVQQAPFTVGVTAQTNPILTGATDQCTATVSVGGSGPIQWSVPTGDGTISSTGLYTAPTTPGTYTITAKATVGGLTESGTTQITVNSGTGGLGGTIN